ncbi:hypothetical protein COO60DRAFT_1474163 [Scenedesmus sp. NREL 46B-D3]|nr:hypothetical protein COO60DRAFT_1474163 [Scenedesmus sp. NREL 46B-D3]
MKCWTRLCNRKCRSLLQCTSLFFLYVLYCIVVVPVGRGHVIIWLESLFQFFRCVTACMWAGVGLWALHCCCMQCCVV